MKIFPAFGFAMVFLVLLVPFAHASVITGFSQVRYAGDLSINSSTLALMTANMTRFYINDAGNIGVGTASPTKELTVNGSIYIANSSSGNLRIEWDDTKI